VSINRKDVNDGTVSWAVVEGGHEDDPDPQKAGRTRVREPGKHGPNVKTQHLPFVQSIAGPGTGQNRTPRPPRPGQLVEVTKTTDGYSYITGVAMGIFQQAEGTFQRMVPQIDKAIKTLTGMRIPPNIKDKVEENRSGLPKVTKEVEEKSEMDRHELYQGVPNHGAAPSMAGLINNPLREISTALTDFDSILDSSVLSQLPGTLVSAGNFLNLLNTDQLKELTNALPKEMQTALNSLTTLKQSDLGGMALPGNFMLGGTVNPATFIPQMLEQLKTVQNFGDLDNVIQSITSTSLSEAAQEGLEALSLKVDGIFGNFTKIIGPNGQITQEISDLMEQALSSFQSTISNIPSAGAALFGSSSNIQTLMNRLKDQDVISEMKQNLEKKHPGKNFIRGLLTQGGTRGTTLGSAGFLGTSVASYEIADSETTTVTEEDVVFLEINA
jgi:hypothetical protein